MNLLNLGCGSRFHPGWTNVDMAPQHPSVLRCDFLEGLPFADQSQDVVYHSHVLEHLPRDHAVDFLRECRRVLKPGGILRVAVPDLERIVADYNQTLLDLKREPADPQAEARHEWALVQMFDQCVRTTSGGGCMSFLKTAPEAMRGYLSDRAGPDLLEAAATASPRGQTPAVPRFPSLSSLLRNRRHFFTATREWLLHKLLGREYPALVIGRFRTGGEVHQWMYDRHNLARTLRRAGFDSIGVMSATESAIPGWTSYQLDTDAGGRVRKPDSLFIEARRTMDQP